MKIVAIGCVAAAVLLESRAAEWDHYQIILDRHPFGALRDATNNVPDYAKPLRLSAIWQARGQLRAGFEDSAAKRNFVLGCGEKSEDGLELVEVHYADESVVIRKGTETAVMHLQAGASTNPPPPFIASMSGSAASSTNNPWREFYERYRSRRLDERPGGATQPMPVAMPMMYDAGAPPMPPMPTTGMNVPGMGSQYQTDGVDPRAYKKKRTR